MSGVGNTFGSDPVLERGAPRSLHGLQAAGVVVGGGAVVRLRGGG